jgi:FkbM family methyltransferase
MNDIGNVDVFELAAWDRNQLLDLQDPNERTDGGGTRTTEAWQTRNGHRQVQGQRLDRHPPLLRAVKDAGRLDLVKIDVEGADLHVLRGLRGLLEQWRPAILLECHDLYGYYTREELEETLTSLGYRFEVAASVPSNWQPGVGITDETRAADYLECLPADAGAVTRAYAKEAHRGR